MNQDDAKLKEIIERINNLPEGAEIPDEILNQLTQEQMLAVFVEKMISDKGIAATDELRGKLYLAMPDYLVEKLNNEIDQGADEKTINQVIKESGIDVETITEQTMMAFREKYLKEEN